MSTAPVPQGVIFDVDGLLVESEQYWDEARREFVAEHGGEWTVQDQRNVMGDNTAQWTKYLQDRYSLDLSSEEILEDVRARLLVLYERRVPVLPGALETVHALSSLYPLGVASSAPKSVIEAVLRYLGISDLFRIVVSSDEVEFGKPRPDVYLLAARRLGAEPEKTIAFEDSINGFRSAKAAGMKVIAVPNREYSDLREFEDADLLLDSLTDFRPEVLPTLFATCS